MERLNFTLSHLPETAWAEVDERDFAATWQAEVAQVEEFTESELHIVTGLLLPIWKRLPEESTRVYRLQTDDGMSIVGRRVSPAWAASATAKTDTPELSPPQALALLPEPERPQVLHQSGEKQIDALRAAYAEAGVQADLTPFIDDTASAYAQADLVIARAGASTVTEIAAVGAAALFVPFPHAVDDHQTTNARFLVDAGAAWLEPQAGLTPQKLAHLLQTVNRRQLQDMAERARAQCKPGAVDAAGFDDVTVVGEFERLFPGLLSASDENSRPRG